MGKSTNGPDWTDLEAAMRAIGSLTPGVVSLTVLPQGIGATGGLRVVLSWANAVETVNGPEDLVVTESVWPCREGCTFEGHVYGGLLGLDAQLEMLAARGELPKA